VQETDYIFQIN